MKAAHPTHDDLAALITAINELLPSAGMSYDDLELDAVAYETGISEEVIRALLHGRPVPDEQLNLPFAERLAFLLKTRLAPDGKPYSKAFIADALGISRAMVFALFKGDREAGRAVAAELEEFFRVDPGFLSTSGRRALARALRPIYATLSMVSDLREKRVSHLAMRSSVGVPDIRLAGQLQEAVHAVLNPAEPDPEADAAERELRELTDQVRALAPNSRSHVLRNIRKFLGQQ
ncbi:hypothetical protein GCM10017562_59180 [Streptomyces roseofulvus]|uniref:Helix-turn-helix transcriptional regulator n=2 Tax=Streptomyces TaxID=1883 RepID=A0ABU4KIR1_9ACTN|nr:helix-turn-helix transcriptional regulator [Streptomyces roseolus]MDX2297690.1 helix-turn-helix transcriptional regulator [Streptomyces roseolus]